MLSKDLAAFDGRRTWQRRLKNAKLKMQNANCKTDDTVLSKDLAAFDGRRTWQRRLKMQNSKLKMQNAKQLIRR
jgi:hypothetical protein